MACVVRPLGHFAHPLLLLLVLTVFSTESKAQNHYSCLDGTGNIYNASIILPEASAPKIGGTALSIGSEIAAFSADPDYADVCVGRVVWDATATSMAVWGDDDLTPERDGLLPADSIKLYVWDSNTDTEYEITSEYISYILGDGIYQHDAALVIGSLSIPGIALEPLANADSAVGDEESQIDINVLANDVEGIDAIDPGTVTIISNPSHGAVVSIDAGTGQLSYLPEDDYSGADSLSYQVSDINGVVSNVVWVSLTITDVNDDPVFDGSPLAVATQNILYEQTVSTSDIENHDRSFSESNFPAWLILSDAGDGTATLAGTPSASDLGDHAITITVTDSEGGSSSLSLTITVGAIAMTVAQDDAGSLDEDSSLEIDVLSNDVEGQFPIDPASVIIITAPLYGQISSIDPSTGALTYEPTTNFHGADSLRYMVYNADRSDSSSAAVVLNISSVNDAPVATADAGLMEEDTSVSIDVLENDSDVDGDELDRSSVTIELAPQYGSIVSIDLNTGAVVYSPDTNFYGADSFTYTVQDLNGEKSNEVAVALWVEATNDPPVLQNAPVVRSAKNIYYSYNPVFSDPEDEVITLAALSIPGWLSFADQGNGTALMNGIPSPSDVGNHTVTITATDASGDTETLNFIISVEENAAPTLVQDDVAAIEDEALSIDILANDVDPENDGLDISTLTITTPPSHGKIIQIDPFTGFVTYDPNVNYNGPDSFEYRITDDQGSVSDPGTVYLTVAPVNDPPVAVGDQLSTSEDNGAFVNVLLNDDDLDGDMLSVSAVTNGAFGTVQINADESSVSYFPNENYFGPDTFTYTVSDPGGLTSTASISVSVSAINDAPVIVSAPDVLASPSEEYVYEFHVTDVDGNILTISAPELPDWLALTQTANGLAFIAGTPAPGDLGSHPVLLQVTDGSVMLEQQFTVSVTDLTTPLTEQTQITGPAWGAINLPENPRFTWVMMENASSYHVQITEEKDTAFLTPALEDSSIVPDASSTVPGSIVYFDAAGLAEGTTYIWRVRARNAGGVSPWSVANKFTTLATSTPTEEESELPLSAELFQNYPNPFNPSTTISFELANTTDVELTVYDLMGREVENLVSQTLSAGHHEIRWDAGNLASGMYLYRLKAGEFVKSKTLSLLK